MKTTTNTYIQVIVLGILLVGLVGAPAFIATYETRQAAKHTVEVVAKLDYVAEIRYYPNHMNSMTYYSKESVSTVSGVASFTDARTGEWVRLSGNYVVTQKH